MNTVWERNDEYNVIDADMKTWHNAAAEIVAQCDDRDLGHLIWRDYQYQYIYNSIQKSLRKSNKSVGLYAGMGTVLPAYRGGGYTNILLYMIHTQWQLTQRCVFSTLTALPAHNTEHLQDMMKAFHVDIVEHSVDEVKYSEQDLVLDGKKVFAECEHLGCLGFHTIIAS